MTCMVRGCRLRICQCQKVTSASSREWGGGSWRFGIWAYGGQVFVSAFLAVNRLVAGLNDGWNVVGFSIYTVWFLLSAGQVLYLMRVRRNDAPFWDEEEARRADFDRWGRQP